MTPTYENIISDGSSLQYKWFYVSLGWTVWLGLDKSPNHSIWKSVSIHLGNPVYEVTIHSTNYIEVQHFLLQRYCL
jgi:hypothetical protein